MKFYQPAHFARNASAQRADALAIMRMHPFATLVTVADGEPELSHAPLMTQERGESLVLVGHLAGGNRQARALADGAPITAIFHGPDAFVSPSWYTVAEAVPTWNYIVVHARGRLRRIDDSDGKERVLKTLIDRHDAPYHARWDALPAEYRERMKHGIVGFEIAVDELAAKFKLSQNRSLDDRLGVLRGMESGDAKARQLGDWMRALGIDR